MNHHTAAQHGENGGWHYVSLNRRTGGHPLGYCVEHEPHATEQEARECYAQYRRDNVLLDVKLGSWSDCAVCGGPTKSAATIRYDGFHLAPLCEEHLTFEHAIDALGLRGPAGDAWQS